MTLAKRLGHVCGLLVLAAAFSPAGAAVPSRVDVRGDDVAFYPYQNETLLAAQGHVVVHAGGHTISGDSLRYDVLTQKILVTGGVRIDEALQSTTGEAYALDLQSGNGELLRIDPIPATYAVRDGDFQNEKEGPAPAKAFEQLDIGGARPYIRSSHAIVTPGGGVRMTPANFPTAAGWAVRLPTFYYTMVRNQSISVNSLPFASFDQPFNIGGSPGSLMAAHLRYDSSQGATVGFDARLIDRDKAYVVASVLPFRDRRIDALAFQQLRPGLTQTLGVSHTIGQNPFNSATYRIESVGHATTQSITTSLSGLSNFAQVDIATQTHDVGHYFTYQLRSTFGYDHNFAGYPVPDDLRAGLGGSVYLPQLNLGGTSFDERYDYTVTTYDYPHTIQNGSFLASVGRSFGGVSLYGSAQFQQINSRYRSQLIANTALGLPDPSFPFFAPDGTLFPGYFAYAGLNTYRTYQLISTFRGAGDNRVQLTATYTRDFPQYHGFGRPPWTVSADVVRRLTPLLRVELGRYYTFGWDERWLSPQYTLSIGP